MGFFFTAAGYLTGIIVFLVVARQRRLATEGMVLIAVAGFAGGILCAKLAEWLLMHWSLAVAHPLAFLDPRNGGRTLVGGILGGWLAVEIAKQRLGIRRSTGDLFALALPAGEAVGRIGCYFNGCCFGIAASVPWAVHQHGAWRHPAQLYAAATAALIFVALLYARCILPREGDLFKLYLALYGVSRFGIEFWRERSIAFSGLSAAQWVCLEMAVMGGIGLAWSWRCRALPNAAAV